MTKTTLNVPDISCGHCKSSIEGALGQVAGVESAEVHIEQKTVDVAFDDTSTDLDAVIAAVEEVGYDVAR